MPLIIKDRVKETTTTTGTGTITLAGASTGFRSFADIGNANTTYYCISGGSQFEVGLGTYTASGTTLSRDTVLSNSLGTTALINFSAGTKDVFVTYPSDKALLGSTSSVSSTGTGSVVLNSNPSFATDITVNTANVGTGGNSNSVLMGVGALQSNFKIAFANDGNVAIGKDALIDIGGGVDTFQNLVGGSGYTNGTYEIELSLYSGAPVITGGIYPTVSATVSGGTVTSVTLVSRGVGFQLAQFQVLTYTGAAMGGGTGFTIQVNQLHWGEFTTAVGYQAGKTNLTGKHSTYIGYTTLGSGSNHVVIGSNAYNSGGDLTQEGVYIGYSAGGSGSNEIVIGAHATGRGNNTITIGNSNTIDTYFYGKTSARFVPRVITTASSATPTINTDNTDQFGLTAQAVDITSFTTNLSGTPVDGQKLWIYIVGTAARAITWGASFEASTVTLPTTTVTTNRLDVGFVWNIATSKWRCVAVA
jgi:hypothetical protein